MIKDIDGLVNNICTEIRQLTDVAAIGLSGGADSTLVAILCMKALGKEKVYGISMPYGEFDATTFNARSIKLAEKLGINSYYKSIMRIANALQNTIEGIKNIEGETPEGLKVKDYPCTNLSQLNLGNARSRARMCVLYGIAHHLGDTLKKRVRVIGTGNLSEDFIGYFTKYGDGGIDFSPIGELFKSEVYQLLDYFKEQGLITEDLIDRVPSAGLWVNQRDQDEIGYTYDEMEPAIRFRLAIEKGSAYNVNLLPTQEQQEVYEFVKQRHEANRHKLEIPPSILVRKFCD